MRQVLRLALKNLQEHKSKTIIIAFFIIFGCAIVILGNSFLESVNRGLEKDFRSNYTGDIVISEIPPKGTKVDIFSASTTSFNGEMPLIPALNDIERISEILDGHKEIKQRTKLVSAKALMFVGEDEADLSVIMDDDTLELLDIPMAMVFAGEEDTYFDLFPGQHITEGTYPAPGSNEILIDERLHSGFEKTYKKELNIGDKVLVYAPSIKSIVREGVVSGFYKPANENSAMFQTIYCTPSLGRGLAQLTHGTGFVNELPDNVDFSLSSMTEDDLFGGDDDDDFFGIDDESSYLLASEMDFNSILGDTTLRNELNKTNDGAWNFIVCKTNRASDADKLVSELNRQFKEEGINAQAMGWKNAAYSYTNSIEGISIIFNILIIILAIVVFIIIMNTMTVSVIERTSEIGTMRAIGAEKNFVRLLFFSESVIITFSSAVIGTLLAFIISIIFNSLNITITNAIAKMILGGGLLHFSMTWQIVLSTILIATAGSIISNLYPVASALKITPLKALTKGE